MGSSRTVLVDMDGVLSDFDGEVLRRLADAHPDIPRAAERSNFYIADDYPDHKKIVRALYGGAGFFASLSVVDGALDGWARILDLGYRPRICSSPVTANPHSEVEKLAWLERHFAPRFGPQVVSEAVITKDKHLIDGVALIDDRPEIARYQDATWRHIIFGRPYNQSKQGLRLRGWADPRLAEVLAGS